MNYLIVDDEPQARKLLQAYMATMGKYHLVKSCANAMEAYEALVTHKVDLMFLDIKMPIVSGTEFLRSLMHPPMVIFTTAYPKYALEGFELNVVDYLLKPIAVARLVGALEKVESRVASSKHMPIVTESKHIFIKIEHKLVKFNLNEILLIEGMQNFVKIHLQNQIVIASITMKAILSMLPSTQFMRVHRSYIVPISLIHAINGNTIEMTYQHVPIGLSYKTEVMETLNRA